jgi:hypothetical protein
MVFKKKIVEVEIEPRASHVLGKNSYHWIILPTISDLFSEELMSG